MQLLDLAAPVSVFGAAGTELGYELRVCTAETGAKRVEPWLTVTARLGLDTLAEADTVIVPGTIDPELHPQPALLEALRAAHAHGVRIAAMGGGVFVLAAAGLLTETRATTHWVLADEMRRIHPEVVLDPTLLYVRSQTVFTCAGAAAALDLCIELIRLDHGLAAANSVARRIIMPPHRSGDQAQLIAQPVSEPGKDLRLVRDWALHRIDQQITLNDLSQIAHMAPRTLARRFQATMATTPLRWLLEQRIRLAQLLLETTDESLEQIAKRTGLGTPSNFRSQFTKAVGKSPRAYRRSLTRREPDADDDADRCATAQRAG